MKCAVLPLYCSASAQGSYSRNIINKLAVGAGSHYCPHDIASINRNQRLKVFRPLSYLCKSSVRIKTFRVQLGL